MQSTLLAICSIYTYCSASHHNLIVVLQINSYMMTLCVKELSYVIKKYVH